MAHRHVLVDFTVFPKDSKLKKKKKKTFHIKMWTSDFC